MKNTLKSLLFILCLACLTAAQPAEAYVSSRFDGAYFSLGQRAGAIVAVELTIDGTYVYGTVLTRDGDDPYFNGNDIDSSGSINGPLYNDAAGAKISGRVSGSVVILTVKSEKGTATFVCVKASGYAPTYIAGKGVYFYYYNPSYTVAEFEADYFNQAWVYTYQFSGGIYTPFGYKNYTYRKTGPNTATITVAGVGTYQLIFTDPWEGHVTGPGVNGGPAINTTFYVYDYGND